MKTYIFSYNNHYEITNDDLDSLLKEIFTTIGDFKKNMDFSFFISSNKNAQYIADIIINKIPHLRFFITEIGNNRQGWLPKETWIFIKENSE
jgi:hypothetical protein